MPDETPGTTYNVNSHATVGQLKALAIRARDAVADAVTALPVEMFLDTAKTSFVDSFSWSNALYPGSTNPDYDTKPVLVLAMNSKDNKTGAVTTSYSFLNMQTLVYTYRPKTGASANVLNISGYEIEFKLDSASYNKASITNNGLLVNTRVSGATNGHIAALDANGELQDGGIAASDIITAINNPTNGNIATINTNGKLTDGGILAADIVTKVTGATNNNLPALDANGKLKDSGIAVADIITTANVATDAEVKSMLDEVFGPEVVTP